MELVFATNNLHKIQEIQPLLGTAIEIKSLSDIGCTEDIAETGDTFEANASIKSTYIWENYAMNCFADDSGLIVDALNGEPGVYSARYSGSRDPKLNLDLVLERMQGKSNRSARFVSVLSLILDGQEYLFSGEVAGSIAKSHSGVEGFGYDPIFIPKGYSISFSEMDLRDKNAISHRSKALAQLLQFLKGR